MRQLLLRGEVWTAHPLEGFSSSTTACGEGKQEHRRHEPNMSPVGRQCAGCASGACLHGPLEHRALTPRAVIRNAAGHGRSA